MVSQSDTHASLYALQQIAIRCRNDPRLLDHAPEVSRVMDCVEIIMFYLASNADRTPDLHEQLRAIDAIPGFKGILAAFSSPPSWHGRDWRSQHTCDTNA